MQQAEFDALYEREWSGLVAAVTLVCGDQDEAADCVQEAFTRAWQRRGQLGADAGGWVRTTALRTAVSRWRAARNASVAWLREASRPRRGPDVTDRSGGLDVDLWQALARLPKAQREALVMHHVLDLPLEEVARIAGAPVGTIKARLSRGRTACAQVLNERATSRQEEGRR